MLLYACWQYIVHTVLAAACDCIFTVQAESIDFVCEEDFTPTNVMDRWILSFTQSLLTFVREEMASECVCVCAFICVLLSSSLEYRLYTVVPRLVRFIDQLTNWYVRFNRKRLKVSMNQTNCTITYHRS